MCKYGVEFVRDHGTQEFLPTLHFLSRIPITEDDDYRQACMYAPPEVSMVYQRQAAYIEQIQRRLIAPNNQQNPVDIFLCYKATREDGRTETAELRYASELHTTLREMGYSVFFAHRSLQSNAAGANYEAQIFHALYSAKVMLLVCGNPAYLNTPWVRSEWRRFMIERMDKQEDCRIIPLLFDRCNPYELPEEFLRRGIQGIRMDELSALDNLRSNLQTIIRKKPDRTRRAARGEAEEDQQEELQKALMPIIYELERGGNWSAIGQRCGELILKHPSCGRLYLYRLLASLKLKKIDDLRLQTEAFETQTDWAWAMRCATEAERAQWLGILQESQALRRQVEEDRLRAEAESRAEQQRRREERQRAEQAALEQREEAARIEEERWEQCCHLLQKKKWEQAMELGRQLSNSEHQQTVMLFGKYHIAEEEDLPGASLELVYDVLWKWLLGHASGERRDTLQRYEQQIRKRAAAADTRKALLKTLFTTLLNALGLVGMTFGTQLLEKWLPDWTNMLFYASAAICYVLFAFRYHKYEENTGWLIFCAILIGVVGVGMVMLNMTPLAYIVAGIMGLFMLTAIKEAYEDKLTIMPGLSVTWLTIRAAVMLLDLLFEGNILHDLLQGIYDFCDLWGAIIVIALSLFAVFKYEGDDNGLW